MAATGPRQVLAVADVLAERYRLVHVVHEGESATLWEAVDEVLDRPVALKAVPAGGSSGGRAARALLAAAGRAAALSHPGLVRVYDATVEERQAGPRSSTPVAFVTSEWVDGQDLHAVLTEGPLEPAEVARLGIEAAEALGAAHARGTAHGRVHPGNVLLDSSGRVRLTDAAVGAALAGRPLDPVGELSDEAVAADTRDLSAVLYAMLTARWPAEVSEQPAGPLASAPSTGGRVYGPRQVRAGVPRALDDVVSRGLRPGTTATPAALAAALRATGVDQAPAAPAPRVARGPSRLRRVVPWVAAAAFIAAFATGTYTLGRAIGELPSRAGDLEALVQATTGPSRGASAPAVVRVDLRGPGVAVRDYDPRGDQREQTSRVVNATDGDPSTAWTTDRYRGADLGGLKSGVGLLVDLGRPTSVGRVDLGVTRPGADVELRAGNALGPDETALPVVASAVDAGAVARLTPARPTTARYWLVWFTDLPRDGDGFRSGISELLFNR